MSLQRLGRKRRTICKTDDGKLGQHCNMHGVHLRAKLRRTISYAVVSSASLYLTIVYVSCCRCNNVPNSCYGFDNILARFERRIGFPLVTIQNGWFHPARPTHENEGLRAPAPAPGPALDLAWDRPRYGQSQKALGHFVEYPLSFGSFDSSVAKS
jgi:hypothetical protein